MVRKQQDQSTDVEPITNYDIGEDISISEDAVSESDTFDIDIEDSFPINQEIRRLGGPTGGDFRGGGGPAIGQKHPADDATADHYGSREETIAALEEKIAVQNTKKLHERL